MNDSSPTARLSRVLVVDDNEVNRDILQAYFRKLGHDVYCASSGVQALQILTDTSFDLILMDCQMPKMDGYGTTRAIREMEKGLRRTPIVAVTASGIDLVKEECMASGMDDVVAKPVTVKILQDILARWVGSVDAKVLNSLQKELEGSDVYPQAIDTYLKDAVMHLDALTEASQKGDIERIHREAHILKGSSSYFGAHRLVDLSRKLESVAGAEGLFGALEDVLALQEEFQRVRPILEAECSGRRQEISHGPL